MPSGSRRSVLACVGSLSVTGLSGCSALTEPDATLGHVTVDAANGSDAAQTFHVAVETVGGLGAWHTESLAGDGQRTVDVEPPDDEPPVALHGFVDDRPVRIDLDAVDLSGTVCLHVFFYYRVYDDEPVAFALTADASCS
jgi:hypothetical protein